MGTARGRTWLIAATLIVLAGLVPVFSSDTYILSVLILVLFYITLANAWNLIGGFAGQVSLGHSAFMGIGAYSVAILGQKFGISPWLGMVAGAIVAVAFAFPFGYICFRLKGVYFILVTLAAAEVVKELALNWADLTRGAMGMTVPSLYGGLDKGPWYWTALALALASTAAAYLTVRSKLGYNLVAIREDEDAASAVGINVARDKQAALALSVLFTSLAGAFYGSYVHSVDPDSLLSIRFSVEMLFMPIVGGVGTILGPVVGAIFLAISAEYLRTVFKDAYLLMYGVLLVVVIMFMPSGIMGAAGALGRIIGGKFRARG